MAVQPDGRAPFEMVKPEALPPVVRVWVTNVTNGATQPLNDSKVTFQVAKQ